MDVGGPQLGLVNRLWADFQPDLFAHTFLANGVTFNLVYTYGPYAGSLVFL